MKQIFPDLWQTEPENPFPRLTTQAYLLMREHGNVLFYSSGRSEEHQRIKELGGITHQYLSHRDEVGPALFRIKEMFGSKLCCHRLEEEAVAKACPVDLTFEKREIHLGDIEVIPTPGHTDGSTCFQFTSPHGKVLLFVGDTLISRPDGTWGTIVTAKAGGNPSDLADSLRLLRELNPDVLLASGISTGSVPSKELAPGEWHQVVDEALATLS